MQTLKILENRLLALETEKSELLSRIAEAQAGLQKESIEPFQNSKDQFTQRLTQPSTQQSAQQFSPQEKIELFMDLFRGRRDVFPKRWDNLKTGKSGYSPTCSNEWVRGTCNKPKVKCFECPSQAFIPVGFDIIRGHLTGVGCLASKRDHTIGVYPMLKDDTCWFLAVDFDKKNWQSDARAFMKTCQLKNVPASLERSRSGNGGHIWIFFKQAILASKARKLGSALLTETMETHPDMGFESYDRFFPNQDTLPSGGFGNLIALPKSQGHGLEIKSML